MLQVLNSKNTIITSYPPSSFLLQAVTKGTTVFSAYVDNIMAKKHLMSSLKRHLTVS